MSSPVVIIKGPRGHEPVFKALELVDYKKVLAGYSSVLIKVNFICENTWETGATTDPLVVEAIILKLKQLPETVKIYVVESDASITNADKSFEATGMKEMCERNGVEWMNLRYVKDKVKLKIQNGEALKTITVPRIATESAVISAAKMKTHTATTVTLGMKNMFGVLPDKLKMKYHARGISGVIVDINSVLKPTLTVIDGFVAMEGHGPVDGDPVQMDLIIAGADPVATDAACARIMCIDPTQIKHIRRAAEKGIGKLDAQIVGETIESVARSFKRAKALK
jgi:uncharacterized protein (DUF362 family)